MFLDTKNKSREITITISMHSSVNGNYFSTSKLNRNSELGTGTNRKLTFGKDVD
jgi:hypothetical protein